ncbi:hypothetical protein SOVF_199280 [Spinacia oleracea]|uniref:CCT domain-containing protein n=1 Tax=Spinacia oleracea TaxID=3562 RepID=A0A9R0JTS4_SPIOL|nr:uncharacterized protein LOC110786058 [Spinacia oleracea]KNA04485.1 hypothetical protein SOVF_199280 [Spinacia oleracea]
MAKQSVVSIATPEDLCNWEFVNRFDFDIVAGFEDDQESIYDLVDSIDSLSSPSASEVDEDDSDEKKGPADDIIAHQEIHDDVDDDVKSVRVSDLGENHGVCDVDLSNCVENQHDENEAFHDGTNLNLHGHFQQHDDGHQQQDDDGHDDDDNNDDIDDELVPWEVKDRFARQRIRKSGKNTFGKMMKSKKSAHVFTRPGCVRGKHGLGLTVY